MSDQITTALQQEYHQMVEVGLQQRGSRLEGAVRLETVNGKYGFFDRVESTTARKRTTRHADSPQSNTPHTRRRVQTDDYDDGDFIDRQDLLRIAGNPQSAYVQNRIFALGRSKDQAIIDAAFATAYEGETGATSVSFPAAQEVAVNHGGSSEGLTVGKLREAKRILDAAEATDEQRFCAVSAKQLDDLLGFTQVTSSDYNTVKALVQGEIDTFLGFKFIRTELLLLTAATDVRSCVAWCKSGLLLGKTMEIETRITERADKSFSDYIYARGSWGATRMYEEKVVKIECDESP